MPKPQFKRIPHWCGGTGLVWLIIHPDGREERTLLSASGKGMFKKAELERTYPKDVIPHWDWDVKKETWGK